MLQNALQDFPWALYLHIHGVSSASIAIISHPSIKLHCILCLTESHDAPMCIYWSATAGVLAMLSWAVTSRIVPLPSSATALAESPVLLMQVGQTPGTGGGPDGAHAAPHQQA